MSPNIKMMGASHAVIVDDAIRSALAVTADCEPGVEVSDHAALVLALADDIGVVAILRALSEAANSAANMALGGDAGADFFHGLTSDDLKRVEHAIDNAIVAISGGAS